MEAIDRLILFNQEAEEFVIGSIFQEPELLDECDLKAEEFSPGTHYKTFATLLDLKKNGKEIDLVNVLERLGKHIDQIGGITKVAELASSVPSTRNFQSHCKIIREHYLKRELIKLFEKSKDDALENDVSSVFQNMRKSLDNLEENGTDDSDGDIRQALLKLVDKVESATGKTAGIYPGFRDLQKMIYAYQPGQLVVTGARPSIGKTAYMVNSALNMARSTMNVDGDVIGIFSLETMDVNILERFAASIGNIDLNMVKTAATSFGDEHWRKFHHSIGVLSHMDLVIFDNPRIDVGYIRRKIKRVKKKYPNARYKFFIDYLQLIKGDPKLKNDRNTQISEITRELKLMAMELEVTIHVLSQLSRGVEQRQDKRPMLSDLRESGSIEQDADIVQFLYRDDYYDKETENPNMMEIIVAKQRDGATGSAVVAFLKEFGKIVNIDWGQR